MMRAALLLAFTACTVHGPIPTPTVDAAWWDLPHWWDTPYPDSRPMPMRPYNHCDAWADAGFPDVDWPAGVDVPDARCPCTNEDEQTACEAPMMPDAGPDADYEAP